MADSKVERFQRHILESVETEVNRRAGEGTYKLKLQVTKMEAEAKDAAVLHRQRETDLSNEQAKTGTALTALAEEIQARKRADLTVTSLQDSLVKGSSGNEAGDYRVVMLTIAKVMQFCGVKDKGVRQARALAKWCGDNPAAFHAFEVHEEERAAAAAQAEAEAAVTAGEEKAK